jgi:hypothetical protein
MQDAGLLVCARPRAGCRPGPCSLWLQVGAALLVAMVAACSVDNRPSYGILVQVETDLATPKDLNRVQVKVTQSGDTLLDEFYAIGTAGELPPIQIPIGYRGDRSPASFTVTGFSGGQARVERFAITTIPSGRWAFLRMQLHYLCVDQAAGGEGCEAEHTCVQGACQRATLPESDLPDYEEGQSATAGAGSSRGGVDRCFPTLRCFLNASEAQLEDDCSFQINPEIGSEQLNVALRLARGSIGTCGDSGCYVPFDQGAEGFTFETGRVGLPPVVCERLQSSEDNPVLAVMFSNACPAKQPGIALCNEETESDTSDVRGGSVITGFVPDPSVGPACEGGRIRRCGMCGTEARACSDGNWSDYGACADEGECVADSTRACAAEGVETCGGDCSWGECLGQRCRGAASRACERCGTQPRACENGDWGDWGECSEQGACMPGETRACGSQGTQACGGNCAWGPCGDQICPGAPTEACGMCGTRSRTCNASTGQWSEFGACSDEGVCMPDVTRDCGSQGTQVCGGNCQWSADCTGQVCTGERAMACGNCGTRTRACDMNTGTWLEWSPCTGEGVCQPDATRGCGRGGTQVCDGSCNWDDACTGQSCLGANRQVCGNCGEQTRSCDGATGMWGEWSSCSDQGECRPNSVRSCGTAGTQECGEDCRWEDSCSGQRCTGETARPCGNCGLERRTCDSNTGQLSAWGACEDQGECRALATRACGSQGTQRCDEECRWETTCTGQVCAEPPARECGNCGRQTSTCDPNTGRANWSTCTGEGQCEPGTTQECGSSGVQLCESNCRWAMSCTMQACTAPRPSPQRCGNCGTRSPVCNTDTGEWTFPMTCANERACAPGSPRRCGTDNAGRQTCSDACEWGSCAYECTEPLTRSCGLCGTGRQQGVCDTTTGRVEYEAACSGGGVCMTGASQPCSTDVGSGTWRCTSACQWPTDDESCNITDYICDQPEGVDCGRCGTTGMCMPNGQRACLGEPEDACVPGNRDATCSTAQGSGYYACNDDCEQSRTCTITRFVCAGVEGAACEGQCGFWGPCNTANGQQTCEPRADVCTPGSTTATCSTAQGSGYYACSDACELSRSCTITRYNCEGVQGESCNGQCGNWGACNTSNGEQACEPRREACVPGSTTATCSTGQGSGYYACSDACELSESCTITRFTCPGVEGASCEGECGNWGPCNTSNGRQECEPREGACTPESTDAECSDQRGTGYYACSRQCVLSDECTITDFTCPGVEGADCYGSCGIWGECNRATGEQNCNPRDGACTPNSTDAACETAEGTGYYACSGYCELSETCTITSYRCEGVPGAACEGQCGTWGPCNTETGAQTCVPNSEACTPESESNECETSQGTGYYECDSQCVLATTCTITSFLCEGVPGARCDDRCGTWGTCDSSNGAQTCIASESALCTPGTPQPETCVRQTETGPVTGRRTCDDNCQWGDCIPIIVLN